MITPKTVMNEKDSRNVQSTYKLCKSPKKPISALIQIITNDVPTAFFMGKCAHSTKAGTYRKPPPAPIIPVMLPISKP